MRRCRFIIEILTLLLLSAAAGMLLGGCAKKDSSGYVYYHLDEEGTALETDECEVTADASGDVTESLILVLMDADPEILFPEEVSILGYSRSDNIITMDFSASYAEMDAVRELLCRAAVTETLLQAEENDAVCFTVEGQPLTDESGDEIGLMTENTFITNPASQINSVQQATVLLYFTDSSGQLLYPEQRTLYYFTSMSTEWMVVRQLIDGPEESSLSRTVPAETSIINVISADGICYVNLDQAFLSTTFTVTPEVTVYSIVNSLCALDGVDSVQITIDGSSDVMYQDTISLNQSFTMNEDLIASDADPIETEVEPDSE